MQHELDAYLHHLQQQGRLQTSSFAVYRRDLYRLLQHAQQAGVTTWAALDAVRFRQVFALMRPCHGSSYLNQKRWLSIYRGFFRYQREQGLRHDDPTLGVVWDEPRLNPSAGFLATRDKALLELSLCSNCTVDELLALEMRQVFVEGPYAHLCLPSGECCRVALHSVAWLALRAWLDWRRALPVQVPYIFVSREGLALDPELTRQRLQRSQWRRAGRPIELASAEEPNPFVTGLALDFKALAGIYARSHPRARRLSVTKSSAEEKPEHNPEPLSEAE